MYFFMFKTRAAGKIMKCSGGRGGMRTMHRPVDYPGVVHHFTGIEIQRRSGILTVERGANPFLCSHRGSTTTHMDGVDQAATELSGNIFLVPAVLGGGNDAVAVNMR